MPLNTIQTPEDIKVIDDFLPANEFSQLEELMMGRDFPWYFIDIINYEWSEKEKSDVRSFQFVHLFLGVVMKVTAVILKQLLTCSKID